MSDLTFGPSFKVKRWFTGVELSFWWTQICIGSPMRRYSIDPRGLQCETNTYEIMGLESFDVVTCGLGPLLQDQMRTAKLKSAYNLLIIGTRSFQSETYL